MDETAVHFRVELFLELDSVNSCIYFCDIFVVASEIQNNKHILVTYTQFANLSFELAITC